MEEEINERKRFWADFSEIHDGRLWVAYLDSDCEVTGGETVELWDGDGNFESAFVIGHGPKGFMSTLIREIKEHEYWPDYQASGDCVICGNVREQCHGKYNGAYGKDIRRCSKCRIAEEDTPDNYLSEMSVITQPGEEGFSHVTMWLCGECEGPILKGLMDLGFKNHMHGGTAFLQDHECEAGYDSCQEPRGYGEYVVGNPFYSEKAF